MSLPERAWPVSIEGAGRAQPPRARATCHIVDAIATALRRLLRLSRQL